MPVGNTSIPEVIYPIDGVDIGVTAAGVRYKNRDDLVIFRLSDSSHTVAVTTTNAFSAAPVQVLRQHIAVTEPRYLIINTGNANAATGDKGIQDAKRICDALAALTQTQSEAILPFSTGVIGEILNLEAIINGMPDAIKQIDSSANSQNSQKNDAKVSGWIRAANGILTTDTIPKIASSQVQGARIQGTDKNDKNANNTYHITGIAKGSGMIRPNMATMLAYVATDANIEPALLQQMLTDLTAKSFNRITVDGDTSTNDCCLLIATGKATNDKGMSAPIIDSVTHPDYAPIYSELAKVFLRLAQLIIRDGEGASKFITVKVTGGASTQECSDVAYAVAHSPLVKTAFFASDPNWGRLLAAIGYAGVPDLKQSQVSVSLDDVLICERGQIAPSYREDKGQQVMSRPEITVNIDLGRGEFTDTVYTCDLSYDYIKINADYRS